MTDKKLKLKYDNLKTLVDDLGGQAKLKNLMRELKIIISRQSICNWIREDKIPFKYSNIVDQITHDLEASGDLRAPIAAQLKFFLGLPPANKNPFKAKTIYKNPELAKLIKQNFRGVSAFTKLLKERFGFNIHASEVYYWMKLGFIHRLEVRRVLLTEYRIASEAMGTIPKHLVGGMLERDKKRQARKDVFKLTAADFKEYSPEAIMAAKAAAKAAKGESPSETVDESSIVDESEFL